MVNYVGDANANYHIGTVFKDTLDGQGGNDTLFGQDNNDSILGGSGADQLDGGDGKDTIIGGLDADNVNGGSDNDVDYVYGNEGNDIVGGYGRDVLQGGDDFDYLALYMTNLGPLNVDLSSLTSGGAITFANTTVTSFESGFIFFGAGDDKVRAPSMLLAIVGGDGNDTLLGGVGGDELHGGYALTNDSDVLKGGQGIDALKGGIGDVLDGGDGTFDSFDFYFANSTDDFTVDFSALYTGGNVFLGFGTRVVRCERGSVQFGSGDDKVEVGSTAGGQTVYVTANGGNDTLIGGDGDDLLSGGQGNDVIRGGGGIDTANYQYESAALTIDLNITTWQDTGGAGTDMITGCERVNGSQSGDRIVGDAENNIFEGYDGGDTLIGGQGDDTLNGDSGGYDNIDRLSGGAGRDTYNGGAGDDVLIWSATFHTTVAAPDQIQGLQAGDVLHLKDIDADTTTGGDQAFTLVGALTGVAGQLALVFDGTKTQFRMDTNGDGAADGLIEAAGDHTGHTEFVL